MILPTKHISEERALVRVGAEIIQILKEPKTVSRLWNDYKVLRQEIAVSSPITFDWFLLALDFLYTIGAIDLKNGYVSRARPKR